MHMHPIISNYPYTAIMLSKQCNYGPDWLGCKISTVKTNLVWIYLLTVATSVNYTWLWIEGIWNMKPCAGNKEYGNCELFPYTYRSSPRWSLVHKCGPATWNYLCLDIKYTVKSIILDALNLNTEMFLVSCWSWFCPVHWSQVLSPFWRCSWSSADRRCSNYIWVINNFIFK